MESKKFQIEIGGKNLEVEIKNLAEQANGNVLVRYGDTLILATCVMSKEDKEDLTFFPLTVNYEERYYAAGKIFGSRYIKREGRPSDEAIITSRLIDRAIRPQFQENLKREVQVVTTCLSWDGENDPDIPSFLGASLALSISDIPWSGPLAILRIGKINGKFQLNPTYEEREESELDLVLAGIEKNGEILINMVETKAEEVKEDVVLAAIKESKAHLKKLIDFQNQIVKEVGKEKVLIETPPLDPELEKEIKGFLGEKLEAALCQPKKEERMEEVNKLKKELSYFIEGKYPSPPTGEGKTKYALDFFEKEVELLIHENIINPPAGGEKRPDGRKLNELRKIHCQTGLLPRTHGSGLFYRGQTKTLSVLTLGTPRDQQLLEGMEIVDKKRFMHHYNFPAYSVGEVRPMRGPGRRDIGHGMLVERALLPLIPSFEEFPYTIRVVSEILSSNGSTSMASISSSSLALMDAGVPIKTPAAGIAIGLMVKKGSSAAKVLEGKNYKLLTDIQGPEDHYGDMDFKVAGTKKGITVIQMDVKIDGITEEILKEVLELGRKSRLQILDKMEKVIQKPRAQLSPYAPKILSLEIDPKKISEVIGPGGRVIREITEECGVSIDVEDTGKVFVTSESMEAAQKAIDWIKNITREIKVGEVFQGKVKRILDFGAMVEIVAGQEGLVHISELAPYRVEKVGDIVKVRDIIPVKVISIDELGRINLSLKKAKPQAKGKKY